MRQMSQGSSPQQKCGGRRKYVRGMRGESRGGGVGRKVQCPTVQRSSPGTCVTCGTTLKGPLPLTTVRMVRWCSVMVKPRVWNVAPALLLLPDMGPEPCLPLATPFSAEDSTSIRGGLSGRCMPMPAKKLMICTPKPCPFRSLQQRRDSAWAARHHSDCRCSTIVQSPDNRKQASRCLANVFGA